MSGGFLLNLNLLEIKWLLFYLLLSLICSLALLISLKWS